MVTFCPNCEKLLRKRKVEGEFYLVCKDCDYKEEYKRVAKSKKMSKALEKRILDAKTRVIEDGDEIELMPKTKVACPECEHPEAYYEQFQTRSADEPATTFYICVKCKHKWREY